MGFAPATKQKAKLRLALMGPTGSGKTFTALTLAHELGKKVALIDSERASASKYSDIFPPFDASNLESHSPEVYIREIQAAEAAGYDVLVIDSLSHAWMGKDGALELVDKAAKRSQSGNSFAAWRDVTPLHNKLVDAILACKCHVIATMRTKQEYVLESVERNGRTSMQPRKVGMAPIQRDGVEYEFDVVADMNLEHDLIVSKTRCHSIDGLVVRKPGKDFAQTLLTWVEGGAAPKQPAATAPDAAAAKTESTNGKQSGASDAPAGKDVSPSSSKSAQEKAAPAQSSTSPKPAGASAVSSKDAAEQSSSPAPKEAALNAPAPASATSSKAAAKNGGEADQKVGAEQMQQLLKAGTANGWTRQDISDFVCHAFKLTPQTLANSITWKQWETAVKLIGMPQNAGGVIAFSSKGEPLAVEHQWPKVPAGVAK